VPFGGAAAFVCPVPHIWLVGRNDARRRRLKGRPPQTGLGPPQTRRFYENQMLVPTAVLATLLLPSRRRRREPCAAPKRARQWAATRGRSPPSSAAQSALRPARRRYPRVNDRPVSANTWSRAGAIVQLSRGCSRRRRAAEAGVTYYDVPAGISRAAGLSLHRGHNRPVFVERVAAASSRSSTDTNALDWRSSACRAGGAFLHRTSAPFVPARE